MNTLNSKLRRFLEILFLILLLIPSVLALKSEETCLNSTHLRTFSVWEICDGTTCTPYNITQNEVECHYGCQDNECQSPPVTMPFGLYIFLATVTVLFLSISFLKRETIAFAYFTVILCFIMAFFSFNLNEVYYEGGSYSVLKFQSLPLVMIWIGFGLIMIVYVIVASLEVGFKIGYTTKK